MLYNTLMPGNPIKMMHKSRLEEEELILQSELYALGELRRRPPKPPKTDTKLAKLMTIIYTIFVDNATQLGKPTKLPATMFEHLKSEYSNASVNKAKKLLIIKPIRRLGRWWWQFPHRAPTEALQTQHARMIKEHNPVEEELNLLRRPACLELQEIMHEHNLAITNMLAVQLMEKAGYQRPTTLRMKAILGIINGKKLDGFVMWYWPNREVQNWIEKKLSSGPVPREQLAIDAWAEKSWYFELLNWARKIMPHIKWRIIGGVGVWVDINHQRGERVESVVEVDMASPDESDRKIIVDFGDEDVNHDLAPEPDKIDLPATVRKTVKLTSGIDLEIFE